MVEERKMMTLDEARTFFENDNFATKTTGITIESVEPGRTVCKLKLAEKHLTAHGGVMGGVIFTLADFCFAVAANAEGNLTLTAAASVNFTGKAKGSELTAVCIPVKEGKRLCVFETTVTDETGSLVAKATLTGMYVV